MYELIKAAHLTAVILWIGATLGALLTLGTQSPSAVLASRLRMLMSLGLVATWLVGLVLATQGGWFRSDWLYGKLALVLVVTATHGMIVGRLRRAVAAAPPMNPVATMSAVIAIVVIVFAIAVLVIVKPSFAGIF